MTPNSPTIDINQFLGLRNVAQSRRLPVGSLSVAQNVDIDDEGGVVSRPGYAQSLVATNITAAYVPMHKQFAYLVDNGNLYRIDSGLHKYLIGAVSTGEIYWAEAGNFVFMSDGNIIDGDRLLSWRVLPPPTPICRQIPGSLQAGIYQVLMTRTTTDGRESASSQVAILEIDGGIAIDNATGYNVYITEPNGTVFYFAGTGATNITDVSMLSVAIDDALILNNPLPESIDKIAFYDACAYVSQYDQVNRVSTLFYSKPFRWHVFDLFNDYLQIPGEIRALHGMTDKLVIATEREILAYNGEALTKLADYGVSQGYCIAQSQNGMTYMHTQRGVCALDQFSNLTLEKVSLAPGNYCSAAFVEQLGIEKFVVLTDGAGLANNSTF